MYLIKNKPVDFKRVRPLNSIVNKNKIHAFEIEQTLPNVERLVINCIIPENSKKMIAVIHLEFSENTCEDEIEKRNIFFFNYFNKKDMLDYFFETPIKSEIDDTNNSPSDSLKIRLYGLPKINPENEFMCGQLVGNIPELIRLENKETLDFIYKNITNILQDSKNFKVSPIKLLLKTFDLNSEEFKDAIMLEYAS